MVTIIIAIPLAASASAFERRGLPRVVGALLALLLGLAVIAGLLALIVPTFIDQVQRVVDTIPSTFDTIRDRIADATGANSNEVGRRIQEYVQGYVDKPVRLIGPAAQLGLGVAGLLANLDFALVFAVLGALFVVVPYFGAVAGGIPPVLYAWPTRRAMRRSCSASTCSCSRSRAT